MEIKSIVNSVFNWFYNLIFPNEKIIIKSCETRCIEGCGEIPGHYETSSTFDVCDDIKFPRSQYVYQFTRPNWYYYEMKDEKRRTYIIPRYKTTENRYRFWFYVTEFSEDELLGKEFIVSYFLFFKTSMISMESGKKARLI